MSFTNINAVFRVEQGVEVSLLFLFIGNLAMPPNIVIEILLGGIAELLISSLVEHRAEEKCLV